MVIITNDKDRFEATCDLCHEPSKECRRNESSWFGGPLLQPKMVCPVCYDKALKEFEEEKEKFIKQCCDNWHPSSVEEANHKIEWIKSARNAKMF